ncbi:MAG TPA: S8 family serine peptidase [Candidatus Nanoarchaeia archaeon]|nr:S8 family serine peptidase [Candidatus Nanoarchaeia archaeon]
MKTIVIISILLAILSMALVGEADTANDKEIFENKELNVPSADFVPNEIIVKFKGDREPFKVIKVPEGKVGKKIKEFKKRADVIYAEPNYYAYALMGPDDTYYTLQWHLDSIQMEEAWDISTGTETVVAVVDTGIRKGTDLANTCFVSGYDFANNDADPIDDNGHGTHVAGTVAQSTNNALGVAGVAFNSCLMPVKVLDSTGSGTYSGIASGIRYAVDEGADVISLSLGGISDGTIVKEAVQYAYENGVTVVAACGNENTATCLYPAAYDDYVIAVGATQYDETKAPYSNYGPSLDIVAPGGNTGVDQNGDGYVDGVLQQTFTINRNRITWAYYFFQGTSMAAPHVSGVAALVIANGVTGPDNVRAALETTAEDKGAYGWDETYGWGLVDAAAALTYVSGPIDNPPSVGITNPLDGDTVSGIIEITADATDYVGVVQVDFYNGSTLIGSDTESPYSFSWDSRTVNDGTYTLTATVTDNASQQTSDSISILVDNVNEPPIANAGPDQSAFVGELNFDGSGSSDPDGTIVSYAWDFGDQYTGTGVTTSHSYTAAGTYTVNLTVTDNDGLTGTDIATVSVNEAPSEVTVFSDSFEIGEWNGLWTEDIQNDWFRSTQRAVYGSYSAEVDGPASNANLTSIPIYLQGKTDATITFSWYIEKGLDSGEYLAFDVSTDGGTTWVEEARLRGNVDTENVWHDEIIDLTGINNLRIQFRGTMSDSKEDANVDMVKVTAR